MELRPSQQNNYERKFTQHSIAQQQTVPYPLFSLPPTMSPLVQPGEVPSPPKKWPAKRLIAISLACVLALALYFIWHSSPAPSAVSTSTQQSLDTSSTASTTSTGTMMRVYVVGAVKHPGVYVLANDARVYDLVQAAGGVQPEANLVALNLAAKLTDGQEVYVTMVGEAAPTCMGGGSVSSTSTGSTSQLVNINTASVAELQQQLHISNKVASVIVNYRVQHGPYSSVDQLSQVVSKATYDKIKSLVTVQ
ncbi:MAG: ComEA family DNA-binding protein [Ktedonobacteraceae bacterium]|nr:ComEA family DNA-binding protein [Ktedonobacteraceae bacterium]